MDGKKGRLKEEEFLTLLGQRYAEQQEEEMEQLADVEAPESLNTWFEEFRKERFSEEAAAAEERASGVVVRLTPEERDEKAVRRKPKGGMAVFMKRVAVFVVVLLGLGIVGATVSAEAFHFDLWKIFDRDEGTNMVINNADMVGEGYHLSSDWYGFYYPSYIPEGYVLVGEEIERQKGELCFQCGQNILEFGIIHNNSTVLIDTEKGDYRQEIIGDKTLYYTMNSQATVVTAYIDSYTILISYGDLSDGEIEKILKNFKFFSN